MMPVRKSLGKPGFHRPNVAPSQPRKSTERTNLFGLGEGEEDELRGQVSQAPTAQAAKAARIFSQSTAASSQGGRCSFGKTTRPSFGGSKFGGYGARPRSKQPSMNAFVTKTTGAKRNSQPSASAFAKRPSAPTSKPCPSAPTSKSRPSIPASKPVQMSLHSFIKGAENLRPASGWCYCFPSKPAQRGQCKKRGCDQCRISETSRELALRAGGCKKPGCDFGRYFTGCEELKKHFPKKIFRCATRCEF